MPNLPSNRDPLIIGIAGPIGAGKTTAAQYLTRVHGFKYLRYSQVLAEWQRTISAKTQLQSQGWKVMSEGMQPELNRQLISRIDPRFNHAIDGLRHPTDRESLQASFPHGFHLIFISCPKEVRWQRLQQRFDTVSDFETADKHPVEQQMGGLREAAEFHLDGSGTEAGLFAQLDTVLQNIQGGAQK